MVASPVDRALQVAPEHYDFERYDDLEHWCSYWHQIRAALRLEPRTALEIGLGTGVFRSYLQNAGVRVTTLDFDPSRKPDYVGDVARLDDALPPGKTFDVVAAFQILEHLPWEELEACLDGIARRAAPYALISLPVTGFQFRFSLGISSLRLRFGRYIGYPWRRRRPPGHEHHWELGRGTSVRKVTRLIQRRFDVLERGYVPENPYHYLWVLRARGA